MTGFAASPTRSACRFRRRARRWDRPPDGSSQHQGLGTPFRTQHRQRASRSVIRRPSCHDRHPMKIALLGPVAWRTPPRHYGPWEQVTSLIAEGLVARGVDVTLFATLDSSHEREPRRGVRHGLRRGSVAGRPDLRRRCTTAHALERSGEFDLVHNHLDWLPLAFAGSSRRPLLTTIHGFSGRRILPAYLNANARRPTSRSRTPIAPRSSTTWRPFITASTSTRCPSPPTRGDALVAFGRIHPDKGTAEAIEIARRAGRRLVICGIVQDAEYFRRAGRAAHRRGSRHLPGLGRARAPRRGARAPPRRYCTPSLSPNLSGCPWSRRWPAGRR